MYAAERRRQILEIIQTHDSVTVADLAGRFSVSTSTIRRDLNQLHRAELLERTYGGAVRPLKAYEPPFSERCAVAAGEKQRIGQAAARLVRPGETIILDGGTTTEAMAAYLGEIPRLTVVTFGVNIVLALAGYPQVTVIAIGGTLQHDSLIFGGVLALEAWQAYPMRFDRAFIATAGVSAEGGVTNVGVEEIPMKRKAIEAAREVILLADASKVGVDAVSFVAPIRKIHRLFTDRAAPAVEVERLRQAGVMVELV